MILTVTIETADNVTTAYPFGFPSDAATFAAAAQVIAYIGQFLPALGVVIPENLLPELDYSAGREAGAFGDL